MWSYLKGSQGLTGETKAGLAVEGLGEGGGIEDGMVESIGLKFMAVCGITWLWNILEAGREGEACSQYGSSIQMDPVSKGRPSFKFWEGPPFYGPGMALAMEPIWPIWPPGNPLKNGPREAEMALGDSN
ncbi:hypothetical protein O181_039910 [Austropuccinia psidii MF-1]|uniref:Uncharacterized protein n=1 Tax=Austropuccinia psidii MF-1 TaxID=1389203 RepID=A0A9Q3DFR1_9BASI|nr:hypothetical protein [Austropuccinia psidii MF-1]